LLSFAVLNQRIMDPTSLISAMIGAQTGMMQLAVAGRLARMNADNSSSVLRPSN